MIRGEKEIKEALKKLRNEHLKRVRQPGNYSPPALIAMIDTLEWILGNRQKLSDFG